MKTASPFDQLLEAAATQAESQRLLIVFANAELPADAELAQRDRFAAGEGRSLAPLICVDKSLDKLENFDGPVAESRKAGLP